MKSPARIQSSRQPSNSLRNRWSHSTIGIGIAVLLLGSLLSTARAVTVFNVTNGASWTDNTRWDNGLPDAIDDGQIPSGFLALGDGLIPNADIFVQSGGTLRVTSAGSIISGTNSITVEDGGRIEYSAAASGNVINLLNGSSVGRQLADTSPLDEITTDDFTIQGNNSTVFFRGVFPSPRSLALTGAISSGGFTGQTIISEELGSSNGEMFVNPSAVGGNSALTGQVIVRGASATQRGLLGAGGTLPLGTAAAGDVNVQQFGTLQLHTNTGVTSTGIINVDSGGRIEIEGTSSGNTINLANGASIGREVGVTSPAGTTSSDAINVASASDVFFTGVNFNVTRNVNLTGLITADVDSRIFVEPLGTQDGEIRITSAGGNSIDAAVIVRGTSASVRGILGLGGTNPLGTGMADHLVVEQFGTVRLRTNTGVTSSTDIIEIQSSGALEIEGTSSGNRVQMATGTSIGRLVSLTSPLATTSSDIIELAAGGTYDFYNANFNVQRRLRLNGPVSGTNVDITVQNVGVNDGAFQISSASGNALTGMIAIQGDNASDNGVLATFGTSPLGTMAVDVKAFGLLSANPGSVDGVSSLTVRQDGIIRLRDNSGVTLQNTILAGSGLVRAEGLAGNDERNITALEALTLNNVTVAPGASAGTLTIEATLTTFDLNSILEAELGGLGNDLLAVEGDLTLTSGSTLELKALSGLVSGNYIIATYTGSLTGEFGSVIDSLGSDFIITDVDYGTLTNSQITLSITQVPEPSSFLLLGLGVIGAALRRRMRRR